MCAPFEDLPDPPPAFPPRLVRRPSSARPLLVPTAHANAQPGPSPGVARSHPRASMKGLLSMISSRLLLLLSLCPAAAAATDLNLSAQSSGQSVVIATPGSSVSYAIVGELSN